MHIEQLPAAFEAALPILETIEAAGYEAYFVGGSVRDTILGKPIHDVDIATSAYPEEIKALFDKTVDTGIEHGTVMILDHGQGYETTTFRTESTYTDFRRPDEVTFVRSLEEDLKRRDFTVNALALTRTGEVIDLFDGLADMENRILRAVGAATERFHEDALRMMRAVRFAAQLEFTLEPNTREALKQDAPLLAHIAVERTNVELTKMLMAPGAHAGMLELLAGRLNEYMPGLVSRELDLLAYAKLLERAQPQTLSAAWTLLAFELGLTPDDARLFLNSWKHSKEVMQTAQTSIALLNQLRAGDVSDWDLYQTGTAIDNAMDVLDLSQLKVDSTPLRARYAALPIKSKAELAVTGRDVMQQLDIKPGPILGQLLNELERAVVARDVENTPTALLDRAATKMTEKK